MISYCSIKRSIKFRRVCLILMQFRPNCLPCLEKFALFIEAAIFGPHSNAGTNKLIDK